MTLTDKELEQIECGIDDFPGSVVPRLIATLRHAQAHAIAVDLENEELHDIIRDADKRITQLEAELAEARKDSAYYRTKMGDAQRANTKLGEQELLRSHVALEAERDELRAEVVRLERWCVSTGGAIECYVCCDPVSHNDDWEAHEEGGLWRHARCRELEYHDGFEP